MHTGLEEMGSGLLGTGKLDKMAVYFAERFIYFFSIYFHLVLEPKAVLD
jgi:hypothetical protein